MCMKLYHKIGKFKTIYTTSWIFIQNLMCKKGEKMKAKVFTNLMITTFLGGLTIGVIGVSSDNELMIQMGVYLMVPIAAVMMIIAEIRKEDAHRQYDEDISIIQHKGLVSYLSAISAIGFTLGLAQGLLLAVICSVVAVSVVMVTLFVYWALFVDGNQKIEANIALNSL